jgi:hypothetical protein
VEYGSKQKAQEGKQSNVDEGLQRSHTLRDQADFSGQEEWS